MSEVEEERESKCVYGGRGQIESVRWSRASKLAGKQDISKLGTVGSQCSKEHARCVESKALSLYGKGDAKGVLKHRVTQWGRGHAGAW